MSMLSAQVDKLRELAARYDELKVGAAKAVTVPSDMGSILRDAADTIWELRGSVNRERAEADTLRTQLADVTVSMGRVEERCAKLRELVRDLVTTVRGCGQDEDGYGQLPCEEVCPHWSNDGECTRLHRDQCWYEEQARELGIEVPDA